MEPTGYIYIHTYNVHMYIHVHIHIYGICMMSIYLCLCLCLSLAREERKKGRKEGGRKSGLGFYFKKSTCNCGGWQVPNL